MNLDATPRTLAAPAGGVLFVADGATKLERGDRDRLVAELRAGRGPARLHVEAVVFRQDAAPNRAFVRFKPAILRSLAKSFVGLPFLRDHEQRDLAAVGGSILVSEFHGAEGHGEIRQTLELVKPWAIEAALDGTMSRFSIAWNNISPAVCSECDAPLFRTPFGPMPGCTHMPGDELEVRGGGKRFVETMIAAAEGVETSAVTVPAVRETSVESIRAALSLERSKFSPRKERPMSKLHTILGLAAEANDDSIAEGVAKLALDRDKASALHAAAVEALSTARARIGELEGQLATHERAGKEKTIEGLLTVVRKKTGQKLGADGKPERGGTPQERVLLDIAEHNIAEAEKWALSLEQLLPVGVARHAGDPRAPAAIERASIDEAQRQANVALGVSDEDYKKFRPQAAGEGT